jgi:hypothetical protein
MAGKIGRDHGVGARQAGDQVPPGAARAAETMDEQHCWPGSGLRVGDRATAQGHPIFHHRCRQRFPGDSRRCRVLDVLGNSPLGTRTHRDLLRRGSPRCPVASNRSHSVAGGTGGSGPAALSTTTDLTRVWPQARVVRDSSHPGLAPPAGGYRATVKRGCSDRGRPIPILREPGMSAHAWQRRSATPGLPFCFVPLSASLRRAGTPRMSLRTSVVVLFWPSLRIFVSM